VHKGEAERKNIRWPRFGHAGYFQPPQWAVPSHFIATMGMPVTDDGVQQNGDLNLAARNALMNMIALLEERGFTKAQAYVICSVAVDLRISNLVDTPNFTVSAFLPEAIFEASGTRGCGHIGHQARKPALLIGHAEPAEASAHAVSAPSSRPIGSGLSC
jgi:acetamidase/formamidase